MPSSTGPTLPPPENLEVDVRGTIPAGLSGRVLGVDHDGVVHAVSLDAGRVASWQTQPLDKEAGVRNVLAFGGTILAFGDDSPAYELSAELDSFRVVDLAGRGRVLAPFPKHDPVTGELHLIARAEGGVQTHVVVSAGALTRRDRPTLDTPERVTDLVLTADRVLFVADGFVGIAARGGTARECAARTRWIATFVAAPHPVHAHDAGDTVVLLALTPSLERWTLHPADGTVRREVLDSSPRCFAHLAVDGADEAPRFVWTAGRDSIRRHDLVEPSHVHHRLWAREPGDFVVVADPARSDDTDGGWLLGFVHDASSKTTDLRVSDAADIAAPAVATIRVPRPIPRGLRGTWIPSTDH